MTISIHVPQKGDDDYDTINALGFDVISIHVPQKGDDTLKRFVVM